MTPSPEMIFVWIKMPFKRPNFSIKGSTAFANDWKSLSDKGPSGSKIAIRFFSLIFTESIFSFIPGQIGLIAILIIAIGFIFKCADFRDHHDRNHHRQHHDDFKHHSQHRVSPFCKILNRNTSSALLNWMYDKAWLTQSSFFKEGKRYLTTTR